MKKFDSRYILYFILAVGLFYVGYGHFKKKEAFAACSKYSLATPTKVICSKSGCNDLEYYFYYGNEKIIGKDMLQGNSVANLSNPKITGKKFFVKFSCKNPLISEICWEMPALEDLINVPTDGWDKLPTNY